MDTLLKENFISTKDAGELSGYSSDYLARLARSGKIVGKKIGHSWFVDTGSLSRFSKDQEDRKVDYVRELARTRETEYRARHFPLNEAASIPVVAHHATNFTATTTSLRSAVFAFSTTALILICAAFVARAGVIQRFAEGTGSRALEVASGLGDVSSNMLSYTVAHRSLSSAPVLSPSEEFNFSPTKQFSFFKNAPTHSFATLSFIPTASVNALAYGLENVHASLSATYAFLTTPSLIVRSLTNAVIAFGTMIIDTTHFAIHADVAFAYNFGAAVTGVSRDITVLLGNTGNLLAHATARVPTLAAALYLQTAGIPATLAPSIASAVFDAEYTVAAQFVASAHAAAAQYVALISGTGDLVYEGTASALALVHSAPPLLDSFTASIASISHAPALAAALPALSAGEQAALLTYQTIGNLFNSATGALTALFGKSTNVAVVSNPSPTVLPFASSTMPANVPRPTTPPLPTIVPPTPPVPVPPATSHTTVTNYPTYTTVINGASENFVNQSLATLRTNILSTVASMVQPVAAQTATNITSIQQVNMIQDLSNLIVRNGDFRGGTLSNGISVSATTGNFTNLTAGTLSLTGTGTTTLAGPIDTASGFFVNGVQVTGTGGSGTVNAGTTGQVPYYAANGTALTATSSLFLASSGNVGIGTTSPYSTLSVAGQVVAANFVATSTTASKFVAVSASSIMVEAGFDSSPPSYAPFAINYGTGGWRGGAFPGDAAYWANGCEFNVAGFSWYQNEALTTCEIIYGANGGLNFYTSTGVTAGTTFTPSLRFDINSTGRATFQGQLRVFGQLTVSTTTATSTISTGGFTVGTSQLVVQQNSGNIGIGTTSPYAKLSVVGEVVAANFTATSTTATSTFGGVLSVASSSPAGNALFSVGSSVQNLFVDKNTGNVGIWTSSPLAKLHVQSSPTVDEVADILIKSRTNDARLILSAVNNAYQWRLKLSSSDGVFSIEDINNAKSPLTIANNTSAALNFGPQDINVNSGNFGIGTTSPYSMLSVAGQGVFKNLIATSTTATSTFAGALGIGTTSPSATLAVNGLVYVGGTGTSTIENNLRVIGTLRATNSYVGDLIFGNNFRFTEGALSAATQMLHLQNQFGSTTITFTDTGNVGIGTTAPSAKLAVSGNVLATSYEVLPTIPTSFVFGTTTTTADIPSAVLTVGGNVDLYKLATFTLSGVQSLAARMDAQNVRITSLESRVAALESGAVSSASGSPVSFSTSSLASALGSLGIFVEKNIASFVGVITDHLTVGSSDHPTGITMYDKTTGAPYCFSIDNGTAMTSSGACPQTGSVSVTSSAGGAPAPAPTASSTTSSTTSGTTISTSTPPVISLDTTPPVVTLIGAAAIQVTVGDNFTDPGATATDDVDADITNKILVTGAVDTATAGLYTLTYSATDAAGNTGSVSRVVTVAALPPPAPAPAATSTAAPTIPTTQD